MHGGFADAAPNMDSIVLLRRTTQIHLYGSRAHFNGDASQTQASDIQPRLPGSEINSQIEGNSVIQTQIPMIFVFPVDDDGPGCSITRSPPVAED